MTLLVGISDASAFTDAAPIDTNSGVRYSSFTASVSGNATLLYVYLPEVRTAAPFKLGLWSSTGTLLAATSALPGSNGGAGWYSASISSTAITASTVYILGMMANATAGAGFPDNPYRAENPADAGSGSLLNTGGTYPTVPNVAPGSDFGSEGRIPMYADGTTGGAAPTGRGLLLGVG